MLDGWILIGDRERAEEIFSWPNVPDSGETLEDTIVHWIGLVLKRDDVVDRGFTAYVADRGDDQVWLHLRAPFSEEPLLLTYQKRIAQFIENGAAALEVVAQLKTETTEWPPGLDPPADDKVWDPQNTGKWRYFLPWGMAMVNQASLNFFHYPPLRLLEGTQDYLNDPVPVRVKELLAANGATDPAEQNAHSTVLDGAPVAAPDDQGTQYIPNQPPVHLIPIQHFEAYQRAQLALLLNTSPVNDAYTVPLVVYGSPARAQFETLFGPKLAAQGTVTLEIQPGLTTHVLGSNHPYAFYAVIQTEVGSGKINPENCSAGVDLMLKDLVVAGWQLRMAQDPTLDPAEVVSELTAFWKDPAQAAQVCSLVRHQASLYYANQDSLQYQFQTSLAEAAAWCADNGNDACAGC